MARSVSDDEFTICWIAARRNEFEAAKLVLDEWDDRSNMVADKRMELVGGKLNGHNIALATVSNHAKKSPFLAVDLEQRLRSYFPNLQFILQVGVAHGYQAHSGDEINTGNLIVCLPHGNQSDFLHKARSGIRKGTIQPINKDPWTPEFFKDPKFPAWEDAQIPRSRVENLGFRARLVSQPGTERSLYTGQRSKSALDFPTHNSNATQPATWLGHLDYRFSPFGGDFHFNWERPDENLVFPPFKPICPIFNVPFCVIGGICNRKYDQTRKNQKNHAAQESAYFAKCLLTNLPTENHGAISLKFEKLIETYMEFLKFLSYPDTTIYDGIIYQPQSGTCRWILEHPVFQTWIHAPCGMLWITGKRGTGKTTMMQFLRDELRNRAGQDRIMLLDFSFGTRKMRRPTTPLNMLRTLLSQLLAYNHGTQIFFSDADFAGLGHFAEGSIQQKLQSLLGSALMAAARKRQVVLMIDALDMNNPLLGGGILEYLRNLVGKSTSLHSRLKILFSTRHYRHIDDKNVVDMEKHNFNDILSYTGECLFNALPGVDTKTPTRSLRALISRVTLRSRGSFLQAHAMVRQIERLIEDEVPGYKEPQVSAKTPESLSTGLIIVLNSVLLHGSLADFILSLDLACDAELRSICEDAVAEVGRLKFEHAFECVLQDFYQELRQEARSAVQHTCASMLQASNARNYLVKEISDIELSDIGPDVRAMIKIETIDQQNWHSFRTQDGRQSLEIWLRHSLTHLAYISQRSNGSEPHEEKAQHRAFTSHDNITTATDVGQGRATDQLSTSTSADLKKFARPESSGFSVKPHNSTDLSIVGSSRGLMHVISSSENLSDKHPVVGGDSVQESQQDMPDVDQAMISKSSDASITPSATGIGLGRQEQSFTSNIESSKLTHPYFMSPTRDSLTSITSSEEKMNEANDDYLQQRCDILDIDEARSFCFHSSAFMNFKFQIHKLAVPDTLLSLNRVLLGLPEKNVTFINDCHPSIIMRCQDTLERLTNSEWDWWPIRRPERRKEEGNTRVRWKCLCNAFMWQDVTHEQARILQNALKLHGKKGTPTYHACQTITKDTECVFLSNSLTASIIFTELVFAILSISLQISRLRSTIQSALKFLQARWNIISIVLASLFVISILTRWFAKSNNWQYPRIKKGNVESKGSDLPETKGNNGSRQSEVRTSPGTNKGGNSQSTSNWITTMSENIISSNAASIAMNPWRGGVLGWILLGLKGRFECFDIDQLDYQIGMTDQQLFGEIKKSYNVLKRPFRRFFSVWKLRDCYVVKFRKPEAYQVFQDVRGPDYPSDIHRVDYEFQKTDCPPSAHEFEAGLNPCHPTCRLRIFHSCVRARRGDFLLRQIPKRNSPWPIGMDGDPIEAWGLRAREIPSALKVFAYQAIILIGPFVFWIWWMSEKNKSDWQNAYVPASLVIALESLFWTQLGVLGLLADIADRN